MTEKKSRILYINRYLEENTDEEHPATIAEIMACLSENGIPSSRQAVARDIDLLIEAGGDIVSLFDARMMPCLDSGSPPTATHLPCSIGNSCTARFA